MDRSSPEAAPARLRTHLLRCIDAYVPEGSGDVRTRWRARWTVALGAGVAGFLVLFAPFFAIAGLGDIALGALACALGALAVPGLQRRGRPRLARLVFLGLCLALEVAAVVRHGGPASPFLPLLVLLPLYAVLLGGVRGGVVWSVVSLACLGAVHALDGVVVWGALPSLEAVWLLVVPPLILIVGSIAVGLTLLERAARDEVEAASRAKSDMLALVSHELRTPLHGILGGIELLRRDGLRGPARDHLELLDRSGHTLADLIDALLDLKTIETGRLSLEEGAFDPSAALREVAVIARTRAVVPVDVTIDHGVPDWVHGDAARFRQLAHNLVDNAVRHTREGVIAVRLFPGLRLEVADTGPGIPPEQQAGLFDAFRVSVDPATRVHGGLGVGLAVCRRIAERMGGSIGVDSAPGEGSRFWVDLPLAPAEPPIVEEVTTSGPQLRMLVVDDEPTNRTLLTLLLEARGHEVESVASGPDAVRAVERDCPDAVWMDLYLPGMDGVETAKRLWRVQGCAAVPVVAVTASTLAADHARCRDSGMVDVVVKPLRRPRFEAVAAALESATAGDSAPATQAEQGREDQPGQ